MRKVLQYSLFLTLFAFLGFSREFLFVNINNQLYKLYYNNPEYVLPDSLSFLSNFSYSQLYYSKYPLTIFYFLAYFYTSLWSTKILCPTPTVSKWIIYIYAILLILAGIIMLYNYFSYNQLNVNAYTLSRWLMGIAQSPLVAFFTIASASLYTKFKSDQKI